MASDAGEPGQIHFRRPVEGDHARLIGVVDEWWGGRPLHHLLHRLWFQHFTSTSWMAETAQGTPAGFLVGFVSGDNPTEAYVHMIAADPGLRRRGVGRELYRRFLDDVRGRGVRRVTAVTWAGNDTSIAFHESLGFRLDDGPGTVRLEGVPAYPDYEGDGRPIAVMRLLLEG
jgi:ribosomal protein S18 acetylase RimI-like enzyme